MLIPEAPRVSGGLIFTRHSSPNDPAREMVSYEWRGGRVIAVDRKFVHPDRSLGAHVRLGSYCETVGPALRIVGSQYEECVFLCVPDDRRAHVEVAIARLCKVLRRVEISLARALLTRGLLSHPDPGTDFSWRRAIRARFAR